MSVFKKVEAIDYSDNVKRIGYMISGMEEDLYTIKRYVSLGKTEEAIEIIGETQAALEKIKTFIRATKSMPNTTTNKTII